MITSCRSCFSTLLHPVLDLGNQRTSDFRTDDSPSPEFPLELVLCRNCGLAQLTHTAPPSALYHTNYSFISGVNPAIVDDLGSVVHDALDLRPRPHRWLDIACNDGTLLSHVPRDVHRTGIDPLRHLTDRATEHACRVVTDFFSADAVHGERFDIITSVSMFYDVDDPVRFTHDVARVLNPDGVWIVQQNWLLRMLERTSFDNISHEHVTYWSVRALEHLAHRCGLRLARVSESHVNGGCVRTVLVHRDSALESDDTVARFITLEYDAGLHLPRTYDDFATRGAYRLTQLRRTVDDIIRSGGTIDVYGASTRGGTLWQAAGLDGRHIRYVVDRNPDKVGRFMSAIGVPIVSEEAMRSDPPTALLVGPWWFRDQFIAREAKFLAAGGSMIFPLPQVEVVRG